MTSTRAWRAFITAAAVLAGAGPAVAAPNLASAISSSEYHSCVVTTDGGVKCWGANYSGQLGDGSLIARTGAVDVVGLPSGVAAVDTGGGFTCALTIAGGVKCWGANSAGQLGDNTGAQYQTSPVDVLGLASGVSAVATSSSHACALTSAGGVKCWGGNNAGALGDGGYDNRRFPGDVVGLTSGVVAIAAGRFHTCALMASGTVKCWGGNFGGMLGNGTTASSNVPVDAIGVAGAVAIAAGDTHNCAIINGGSVKCWGSNYAGELGLGSSGSPQYYLTPVDALGLASGAASLALGGTHTCVSIAGGGVKCTGANSSGQFGNGNNTSTTSLIDIGGGFTISAISGGVYHTCIVTDTGAVKCTGRNDYWQLGNGTSANSLTFVDVYGLPAPPVTPGTPAIGTATAGSGSATIAFSPPPFDGGSTITSYTATSNPAGIQGSAAASPITVRGLVAGTSYTFTVTASNGVGTGPASAPSNEVVPIARVPDPPQLLSVTPGAGQLTVAFAAPAFNGGAAVTGYTATCMSTSPASSVSASGSSTPIVVPGLANGTTYSCSLVAANSAGSSAPSEISAAVAADAAGMSGLQLNPATLLFRARFPGTTGASQPVVLANNGGAMRTITAISVSGDYSLSGCPATPFVLPPGTSCTVHVSFVPTRAGARSGVLSVSVQGFANPATARLFGSGSPVRSGLDNNFVVTSSGQLWGWGANTGGKLGNGITSDTPSPVRAGSLTGIVAVAPGGNHTLALRTDGTVWAWGLNDKGQLGYTTTTTCRVPGTLSGSQWPCSSTPRQIPGLTGVVAINAGWVHSTAIRSDGTVWSWGSNASNQLGRTDSTTPYAMPGRLSINGVHGGFVELHGGGFHNFARNEHGQWIAWGNNVNGQLGNGSTADAASPVAVPFSDFATVSTLASHTLALKADGTVWAWGYNRYGQLGNGDTAVPPANVSAPVQIMSLSNVVEISAGYSHGFARRGDGSLWTWGLNKSGQLGVSTSDMCGSANNRACSRNPVAAPGHAGAVAVMGGGGHTTTVRPDHSIVGFGDNGSGQLGNASGNWGTYGGQGMFDPDAPFTSFYCPPGQRCFGLTSSGGSVGFTSASSGLNADNMEMATTFAPQAIGTSSAASTLTLYSRAKDGVNIFGVSASGDFSASTSCTSIPSSGCPVYIVFTPTGTGVRNGTLSFTTDQYDNPHYELPLFGVGIGPPSAPRNVYATAENAQATVGFDAPATDGGASISSYTVVSSPHGISASGASSPIVVGGLTNGMSYTFTVRATNPSGPGEVSAPSSAVIPATVPGAPIIGTATAGNAQASIAFTAPPSDGGAPIFAYGMTCGPGGFTAVGTASPIVVEGLSNGTSYSCSVTAMNTLGAGAASASVNVTPAAPALLPPPSVPVDFNADDKPDIVWSNTANGATYVWYMNGTALISDAFIAAIDPSWKVQGIADFNGDGHPDLVWRNTANGNTYVWYMNGAAFVSDAFVFGLPPQWVIQGVADFNNDDKPDFLMRNTDSGVAFAWFFNNAAPIGDQFLFGIDPSWKVEQVGDVNGDGQPDLLFRNMASGLAFAWYTQWSAGSLSLAGSSASMFSIDPAWEIVQLEDWNADGQRDLLFRNRDTGVVFVWYMTGTTLGSSDFVIQIDPSWEIVPRR